MHPASMKIMEALLLKHTIAAERPSFDLYDVGSYDVNGTYKSIVTRLGFKDYKGMDIEAGPNVDIVVPASNDSWELPQRDVVISGQCLEHTRFPWLWIKQVVELAKPGGLIFVIAPWAWPEHRYPVDCWRILPDGMEALGEWCGVTKLEVGRNDTPRRDMLGDCWGVFQK